MESTEIPLEGILRQHAIWLESPHDGRQARAGFVIRRQVEFERERHTIGALVGDQFFVDAPELGRGILESRERDFRRSAMEIEVGRLGGALAARRCV